MTRTSLYTIEQLQMWHWIEWENFVLRSVHQLSTLKVLLVKNCCEFPITWMELDNDILHIGSTHTCLSQRRNILLSPFWRSCILYTGILF